MVKAVKTASQEANLKSKIDELLKAKQSSSFGYGEQYIEDLMILEDCGIFNTRDNLKEYGLKENGRDEKVKLACFQLFKVISFLKENFSIISVLSIHNASQNEKEKFLESLFKDSVSSEVRKVVARLLEIPCSDSAFIIDRIEEIAVAGLLRYATLNGTIDTVQNDIFLVYSTFIYDSRTNDALSSPLLSQEGTFLLFDSFFKDKISDFSLELVKCISINKRFTKVSRLVYWLMIQAYAVSDEATITVVTATKLTDEQVKKLENYVFEKTGKHPHLYIVVDKSVIGGLCIKVGYSALDLTIKEKFKKLREQVQDF